MYNFYLYSMPVPGHIVKFLIIMKFCFLLLIIPLLHVSATTKAQNITINKQNASLTEVFRELRRQTDYDFIYSAKQLANAKKVSINVTNSQLADVLEKCFADQPLTYTIHQKTITIKEKAKSFLDRIMDRVAAIDVRGVVYDDQGIPLAGATVTVKGTSRSTHTNDKGAFYLENVDENALIVITYLGYETKELLAVKDLGNIVLVQSDAKLKEVTINAGYYSVKERELTGNISKVTSGTIEKQPVNNPLMALQGRVAGLQITQQNGIPGGTINVRIRGQNSIRSGNDPLYIVDGVPYPSTGISGSNTSRVVLGTGGLSPLSMINPGDIESIEVLKDADATAIYGSRGANGVILITTKRGKEGNTQVSSGIIQGFSQVAHKIALLNTEEYLNMRREAFKNDGIQPGLTDYDINGTWDQNKYTDWQKQLIGGTAPTTTAFLNIGGGTAKNQYLIAANYYKEGTVYPGDFDFERTSIRSNTNLGSSEDRFTASFTGSYNHTQSNLFAIDINNYIFLPPNAPDSYDEYGQLNWAGNTVVFNPMADLLQTTNAGTDNLIGNLTLNYKLTDNLILKTSLGYTTIKRKEFRRNPLTANSPATNPTATQRTSFFGNHFNNSLIAEPMLTYNANLGKGSFDILAGLSLQDNNSEVNVIKGTNFNSDDLLENLGSAGTITNQQLESFQYRYLAVFGRLNYNLNGKYLINLTARRDGSSRFGPGKQFANFGAIGAAWIFSDEQLIKEALPILSFGKLRVSYGITGNDQISNYAYLDLWNTGAVYQGSSTLTPSTQAPNADFAWETNRKLEAALQIGVLKDRINIEISNYRNRSSNQLLLDFLPFSTGKAFIYRNLPAEIQNTGWELATDLKLLNSKIFNWSIGLNLTIPKNKLLSYPGIEASGDLNNYQIGEPLSILKTYNVSVDKQTGLYTFEDKNGNGSRDNGDRYIIKFMGQSYFGGFQNSIRYKQFNFDFHFVFTKQNGKKYNSAAANPGLWASGFYINQYREVAKHWQEPGDEHLIQKYSTTSANQSLHTNAGSFGNLSVVDASFIRLRNISLCYALPKKAVSFLKISSASIRLQGQNLFTLTNYVGLDPETQGIALPPLRNISAGLNITF